MEELEELEDINDMMPLKKESRSLQMQVPPLNKLKLKEKRIYKIRIKKTVQKILGKLANPITRHSASIKDPQWYAVQEGDATIFHIAS